MTEKQLQKIARLVRYFILTSTTAAGSGHPSSSLSGADLMAGLMFSGAFRADLKKPSYENNDRLIFSKGHAAPLFYALYAAADAFPERELATLRKFGSRLEGHPTLAFPYTEAATGSLGQGLSIGVGMALNAKYLDRLTYRTYVLCGDSEMSEGSVWEAAALAAYYRLDNLTAIVDMNRLGQRGQTMYGHDEQAYTAKFQAFGWHSIVIDGHSAGDVLAAYKTAARNYDKPTAIIAKTKKGRGVSFIEDKDGWHGKPLSQEELARALAELGEVDMKLRGTVALPKEGGRAMGKAKAGEKMVEPKGLVQYKMGELVATRKAYGDALAAAGFALPAVVALDAETSNSTYAETFKKQFPDRFFEMFIAEQNMVGTALGLSRRGKIPFVSTFAAFFSRAYDQIRMSQYSDANIKFVGSHAGVSIGEDGSSQMGLEDLSLFRAVHGSVVLYPCDAVSTAALVRYAAHTRGIMYIRTTRAATPVLYGARETFKAGGSKTLRMSARDDITIAAAGITLHEALAAYDLLQKRGITARVIDCYSIKPLDTTALKRAAKETKAIITVEDHYPEGGLGEAVAAALSEEKIPVHILAVRKLAKSGTPQELLDYEGISARGIVRAALKIKHP